MKLSMILLAKVKKNAAEPSTSILLILESP